MDKVISKKILRLFAVCYFVAMILIMFANKNNVHIYFVELLVIEGAIVYLIYSRDIFRFAYVLFAFSFISRIIIIISINTAPQSDFAVLYDAAQRLVVGDYTFNTESYFQTWAYQTGYVIYEAAVLKIWNNIWALKIMNCVWGAGISVLIYKIAREMWKDEKSAQCVGILYSIFVFPVFHTTVLSNCHPSAFFLYLGIYLLLTAKNMKKVLLSAGSIAIGNVLRPDAIIFVVAIGVFFVFLILENVKIKNIWKQIKKIVVFFTVYFLVTNVISLLIVISGVNPCGLSNQNSLYKFVVGFNYESKGGYSTEDPTLIDERQKEYNGDLEKGELSIIKERTSSIPRLIDLFMDKIETMWWNNSGISWSFTDIQYETIQDILGKINNSEFYWIFILSVLGIPEWMKKAEKDKCKLLIPFVVFAAFSVYLLIEVQPRYAYLQQIAVFILGAGGIKKISETGKKINLVYKNVEDKNIIKCKNQQEKINAKINNSSSML